MPYDPTDPYQIREQDNSTTVPGRLTFPQGTYVSNPSTARAGQLGGPFGAAPGGVAEQIQIFGQAPTRIAPHEPIGGWAPYGQTRAVQPGQNVFGEPRPNAVSYPYGNIPGGMLGVKSASVYPTPPAPPTPKPTTTSFSAPESAQKGHEGSFASPEVVLGYFLESGYLPGNVPPE